MQRGFVHRIIQALTWWNGSTWGTSLNTWRRGEYVGADQYGNRYFRTRGGAKDPALGIERRWVIYAREAEASFIPPGWYGWIHHLTDTPPAQEEYTPREWEKPHKPNLTGTAWAHRPRGSILRPDPDQGVTKGYDAWTPD